MGTFASTDVLQQAFVILPHCLLGFVSWIDGVAQIALDDISLDDLWALDLNKLDGWRCIKENTTGDVKESLESDRSSNATGSDDDWEP